MMPAETLQPSRQYFPFLEKAAGKARMVFPPVYMGPGAAGHIVKTIHNGIEYAEIELISETYDLLKKGLGYSNQEILAFFETLNEKSQYYLLDSTVRIFKQEDPKYRDGSLLVDHILDIAEKNGTGKWTAQLAADAGAYAPIIYLSF